MCPRLDRIRGEKFVSNCISTHRVLWKQLILETKNAIDNETIFRGRSQVSNFYETHISAPFKLHTQRL
jgi:hypothetical protein